MRPLAGNSWELTPAPENEEVIRPHAGTRMSPLITTILIGLLLRPDTSSRRHILTSTSLPADPNSPTIPGATRSPFPGLPNQVSHGHFIACGTLEVLTGLRRVRCPGISPPRPPYAHRRLAPQRPACSCCNVWSKRAFLTEADLARLRGRAAAPDKPLHELLIEKGFAKEEDVLAALPKSSAWSSSI